MLQVPYRPLDHIHQELHESLKDALQEVLNSNQFVLGNQLKSFEIEFARYIGVDHAIGTGSGHDALMLSLKALGIGSGDEVIIPAHTFFATALAVFNAGARPVLAEVDRETCNIDASIIDRYINAHTRAIMPVHLYGNPCDMDPILSTAQDNGLMVVEDFAQAHGARYKNRNCGSIGHINATSFYPAKNLGALGDGGMIATQSNELASTVRKLQNYGGLHKNIYEIPGFNSRLDELQASVLKIKLAHLDRWNRERKDIAGKYLNALKDLDDIKLLDYSDQDEAAHHIFPVRTSQRDQLQSWLMQQGIETLIHYPTPIHHQPAAKIMGIQDQAFPVTEDICRTELSLPIYPGMSNESVDYVCERIIYFFKHRQLTKSDL